jgi:diguanylate cyclase (GGDEF)-like protein
MEACPDPDRPELVLQNIEIFSGLKSEDLKFVYGRMRCLKCSKDEILFNEGDAGNELYVVSCGAVDISVKLPDGKDLVISTVRAGNFFGDMSIIERAPRSATCRAVEDSILYSLHADDFYALLSERPEICVSMLRRMLAIISGRLLNTGSFISQMVQFGESAGKRAITDEATGLFNRRFLDDSLDSIFARAKIAGKPFSMAMFDLDHFGDLNKRFGMDVADWVIIEMSKSFKKVFRESDILVRYGGDEFTFLFPETECEDAVKLCSNLCATLRELRFPEHAGLTITASLGVASFPKHAQDIEALRGAADKALYRSKENGRDRASAPD